MLTGLFPYARVSHGWSLTAGSILVAVVAATVLIEASPADGPLAYLSARHAWPVGPEFLCAIGLAYGVHLSLTRRTKEDPTASLFAALKVLVAQMLAATLTFSLVMTPLRIADRLSPSQLGLALLKDAYVSVILLGVAMSLLSPTLQQESGDERGRFVVRWVRAHAVILTVAWVAQLLLRAASPTRHPPALLAGAVPAMLAATAGLTAWMQRRLRRWHDALREGAIPGCSLAHAMRSDHETGLPRWWPPGAVDTDGLLCHDAGVDEGTPVAGAASVPLALVPHAPMRAVEWRWAAVAAVAATATLVGATR